MSRRQEEEFERHLHAGLARAEQALRRQAHWQGRLLADLTRDAADHLTRKWEREREREREREERRAARRRRHHELRVEELAATHQVDAALSVIAGVVLVGLVLARPYLWWLLFFAFFLVRRGFRALAARAELASRRRERLAAGEERADPEKPRGETQGARGGDGAEPPDPRDARVDVVCEKILAELRTGPAAVRELLQRPEETVTALRDTCRELTRRERELRQVLRPEDDARLERERDALAGRLQAEADPVVSERLGLALQALDQQRQQRAELLTSAARIEAEHTRIAYTLESMYTQMLRARAGDAASADLAGAGLRRSLERLAQEMSAVAEALEDVHLEHPVASGSVPPSRTPEVLPPEESSGPASTHRSERDRTR